MINVDDPLKPFLHTLHVWLFSWVCVRKCFVNSLDWQNAFWHMEQMYGFSEVWIRSCDIKLLDVENALLQYLQMYGLSPGKDVEDIDRKASRWSNTKPTVMLPFMFLQILQLPTAMITHCATEWLQQERISNYSKPNEGPPGKCQWFLPFHRCAFSYEPWNFHHA